MAAPVISYWCLPFWASYNCNGLPLYTTAQATSVAQAVLAAEATTPTEVWVFNGIYESGARDAFITTLSTGFLYSYAPTYVIPANTFFTPPSSASPPLSMGILILSKYPLSSSSSKWVSLTPSYAASLTDIKTGVAAAITVNKPGADFLVATIDLMTGIHDGITDYILNYQSSVNNGLSFPLYRAYTVNDFTSWVGPIFTSSLYSKYLCFTPSGNRISLPSVLAAANVALSGINTLLDSWSIPLNATITATPGKTPPYIYSGTPLVGGVPVAPSPPPPSSGFFVDSYIFRSTGSTPANTVMQNTANYAAVAGTARRIPMRMT